MGLHIDHTTTGGSFIFCSSLPAKSIFLAAWTSPFRAVRKRSSDASVPAGDLGSNRRTIDSSAGESNCTRNCTICTPNIDMPATCSNPVVACPKAWSHHPQSCKAVAAHAPVHSGGDVHLYLTDLTQPDSDKLRHVDSDLAQAWDGSTVTQPSRSEVFQGSQSPREDIHGK